MRTYKYEDYVDINNIKIYEEMDCEGESYRYSLFISFKEYINDKNILVIMRNPSKANKEISDRTVNNVLSFCHFNLKYRGVYLYNLYPYCCTKPAGLKGFFVKDRYESKMRKNTNYLGCLLKDVDSVIVAWGANSNETKEYDDYNITRSILEKLDKSKKDVYAMRFISSKSP